MRVDREQCLHPVEALSEGGEEKGIEGMIPLGSRMGEAPFKTGKGGAWIGVEMLSAAVSLPAVGWTLVGMCGSLT